MKSAPNAPLLILSATVLTLLAPRLEAETYNWSPATLEAGIFAWNTNANWTPDTGFPNATGDVATITANIAGNQTINLNQQITLGSLTFGDPNSSHSYTIAPNGGFFVFDNGASNGQIIHVHSSGSSSLDVISAPIVIRGNGVLEINNNINRTFAITGVISGNGSLVTNGTTTQSFNLSAANTYTGSTTIKVGNTIRLGVTDAIPTTSAVTANGQLILATSSPFPAVTVSNTIGSLSGASTGNINGGGTLTTGTLNTSTTYSGVISGGTGLAKVGTGTQTLDGFNASTGASNITYTGLTTANRGTLLFDRSAATIATTGSTTGGLNVGSGEFALKGGSATATQTFGTISNREGFGTITVTPSATAGATLTGSTLTRINTTSGATILFRGEALGTADAGATANTANIKFTTGPLARARPRKRVFAECA